MKDTSSLPTDLPLSLTIAITMTESDASVSDHNSESSRSESLGTKTLQTRSMVPGSFHELLMGAIPDRR